MYKAALLTGIDEHPTAPLTACVRDVMTLKPLLSKNEDGSPNFQCVELTAPIGSSPHITRKALRYHLEDLFSKRVDVALFYFCGHGVVTSRGGFLVTQDATRHDEGVSMEELLNLANESAISEVAVVLDCCFSGKFGIPAVSKGVYANLREGISILAASSPAELAVERSGRGLFTSLVCGALEGGASDVIGQITAASVYAYVDQALGAWEQRPMFKANLARLTPLRTCRPEVSLATLRKLIEYFPTADYELLLDPSYERDHAHKPSDSVPDPGKESIFADLQRFRAARLLVPIGDAHLFWAAIRSKSCCLTPLGRFYWKLAKENKL